MDFIDFVLYELFPCIRGSIHGNNLCLCIYFYSAEQALHLPVLTFASGPTNSMRGAAFLSGVQDAIVIDIGGTTTDVGVLKGGFPRQASARVKVE